MKKGHEPAHAGKRHERHASSHHEEDRRSQPRSESALSRIEDATYTVLRKHQKTD